MLNKTQLRKDFDTNNYDAGASSFKMACWYFVSTVFFRSGLMPFSSVLVAILRLFGCKAGKDIRIKPFVNIKYPWKLVIGDHTWIGEGCIIGAGAIVLENTICEAGHLYAGIPARKIKPVSDEQQSGMARTADNYVLYSSWFK